MTTSPSDIPASSRPRTGDPGRHPDQPSASGGEPLGRHRGTWVLAAILLVFVLLRVGLLERQGLWADEYFSLAMATGHSLEHPPEAADPARGDFVELPEPVSPGAYAAYLRHESPPATPGRVLRAVFLSDTSPPLYYLLLYGWTLLAGTSDAALRGFSVIAAALTLPIIWSIARRLGGERAASAAAVIFAFSPVALFYSTEGRMYSLMWLWTASHIWLTLRLQGDGGDASEADEARDLRHWWLTMLGWVAVGAAGLLTHYFYAFVWAAACAWLVLHPGRAGRIRAIAGAAGTLLLVLPWYVRLPASLGNWRVTADWLLDVPWEGYSMLKGALLLPWQFVSPRGIWGVRPELDWVILGLVIATISLALREGGWRQWIEPRRQLLWLSLGAACLGPVVFDLWRGTHVVAVPRYALAGLPAAFLLVGLAFAQVRSPLRMLLLLLVVLTFLVGVRRIYLNPSRHYEPSREVARRLAYEAGPRDLVLVHSIPSGVSGVARYMDAAGAGENGPGYAGWVGQLGQRRVPEDLLRLAAGRERITLVLVHEVGEPAPQLDWLEENAVLEGGYNLESVRVRRFVPREGETFGQPQRGS